ncbi:MAG: alpha/beta hydrolase [Myxococcales bacterium]|nr:alpha/beta hydrolase [Myxococcales bacterium]
MSAPALNVVSSGQGPPVVLLHGLLLGSVAQWYFTLAPALALHHRVVMFDLRGHGRSEVAASGYDLATLADDLQRVRAEQGITEPMDLVGHSYGGLVALTLALREPGWVRRLVLVDVPLPPGDPQWRRPIEEAGVDGLLAMLPEGVREQVLSGGRRSRKLLARLAQLAQRTTLLDDVAAERDLQDAQLAQLPHRTLCLVGEESACRSAMARLQRVIPEARLEVVPGGHFVPVEAPDALIAHVQGFLDA